MIYLCIVSKHGQYQSSFIADNDVIQINTSHIDEHLKITIPPNHHSDYWDFDLQQWQSIGEAPSPHHQFNYELKQWQDVRTLDDVKYQKWQDIKTQRTALEFGGVMFEGHHYDSDLISQQRIATAIALNESVQWKTKDNQIVQLSHQQLNGLYQTIAQHITQLHLKSEQLRQMIEVAETITDVDKISF